MHMHECTRQVPQASQGFNISKAAVHPSLPTAEMVAPSTASNGSRSDRSDHKGEKFVALCTGATGISSIHLVRRLLKDDRFGKVYGVSRRDLYDLPVAHVEHVKLDLLDAQKVKDELKSKDIKDGTFSKGNMHMTFTRTVALVLTSANESQTHFLLTPGVWHAVTHLYQVHPAIFTAVRCCTHRLRKLW